MESTLALGSVMLPLLLGHVRHAISQVLARGAQSVRKHHIVPAGSEAVPGSWQPLLPALGHRVKNLGSLVFLPDANASIAHSPSWSWNIADVSTWRMIPLWISVWLSWSEMTFCTPARWVHVRSMFNWLTQWRMRSASTYRVLDPALFCVMFHTTTVQSGCTSSFVL